MSSFLKEVAQDLVSRFGDGLQHCTIVFNNNRPSVYLKKYLADLIQKPFFSPDFCTIQQFFTQHCPYHVADFYLQFFNLLQAYNQLLKEEGQQPVSAEAFFPLANTILSDFNQIDADLVEVDKLYTEMGDIAEIDEAFDYLNKEQHEFLSRFWHSYTELKHQERKQKFIELWRRMPLLYHRFHQELTAQGFVSIGQTYRLLANTDLNTISLISKPELGKIIFVGFNALSRAEAKIFTALQTQNKALFYFDTDSFYLEDNLQEAGLFLRKNLQQLKLKNVLENSENRFLDSNKKITVYSVQGRNTQAKILNQLIDKEVVNKDEESKTVVVLADEGLLMTTMQSVADEVPLNITMGFALSQSSIYGIIDLWLEVQMSLLMSDQLHYSKVEAFALHPLTALSDKMIQNIQSNLINDNAVKLSNERIIKHGGLMELFFKKTANSSHLIADLTTIVQALLKRQIDNAGLKELDSKLFAKVIQVLNRLRDTLVHFVAQEKPEFVIRLLRKALKEVAVPLDGSRLNGLQIMGLLETRNLNFEKVIFLGFNEGILPKSSLANTFIPDSIRRAYGLPVMENLDAVSAYMVYRLVQRAKEVSVVYNNFTDLNSSGEVSRFLHQMAYESKFQFKYYHMNLQGSTENNQEILIEKTHPKIQQTLMKYLNGEIALSPSAITMYICNPIDFFFRYIADIKEPKEVTEEIKINEMGSVFHKSMELFYENDKGIELTADLIKMKRKNLSKLIEKAFVLEMKLKNKPRQFNANQQIVLAVVQEYMNIALDKDENDAPFVIKSLEYKFSGSLNFELKGKKQEIRLSGYIDRIDIRQGITRIIDYKTGSDKLTYPSIEKLFDTDHTKINKAMVQLLIYTYSYAEQFHVQQIEPHLYVLKELSNGQTQFKKGKNIINLDEIKDEFMTRLGDKIAELFDLDIPFRASKLDDNYPYSIYRALFGGKEKLEN